MKKHFTSPIFLLLMLAVFAVFSIMLMGAAGAAEGNRVTLAWDANTESDLAGYNLYYDADTIREDGSLNGEGADQGAVR